MKKVIALAITPLILFIAGCAKHDLPPSYVGTWSANGTTLILNKNNTYELTNGTASYAGTGTYTVSNQTITVKDLTGVCNDSTVGSYTFNYFVNSTTGTFFQQLSLSVITDTCPRRAAILPGTYIIGN